jgi:23S rRNA pseudouridine1911/1915/1917 synthase
VLYEDEWILGVDKPAGLPVHPTARFHANTLTAVLKERYGDDRPILAHRLDSETSGVLLCAKTKEAERKLKLMFVKRTIQKTYFAVVFGVPNPAEGQIESPIGSDVGGPVKVKMACRPDGLPALTGYRVVKSGAESSLLLCLPRTGRQHQIRVHLAHIGHPVVGDKMYGYDPNLFLEYIEFGPTPEILARTGAPRHLLHAASISLTHPMTGEPLTIESPLHDDIKDKLNHL